LTNLITIPSFVQLNDWAHRYFPHLHKNGIVHQRTKCAVIVSTRHAFMDAHFDYGGAALWYHVFQGQKHFILIAPTPENLKLYHDHINGHSGKLWFPDAVIKLYPETIYWVTLNEGMTIIVPPGYIHAVYTTLDTIAFAGNFLYDNMTEMSLHIHNRLECLDQYPSFYPNYRLSIILVLFQHFYDYNADKNIDYYFVRRTKLMILSCLDWIKESKIIIGRNSQVEDKELVINEDMFDAPYDTLNNFCCYFMEKLETDRKTGNNQLLFQETKCYR
jgi:hypothetical protein